ncbi:MAG: RNA polymerase sigma factor [Candidatus Omnitrophica bacterium]|nr:RNA polymerase sigma factor [Candidatus Omnitrophota bacterium]
MNIPLELIEKAKAGDMRAFREIYDMTAGFVYAVSYRIMNNRMDAQEIAQDVFCKIHSSLASYRENISFKAWIYRITVNTAINYYHKVKRRRGREIDIEEVVETAGVGPEVEKNLDKEDKERKVQKLLSKLTPDHRAAIVLREIEGLSYEEMAQTLGININTVRTRLKRARTCLVRNRADSG